MRGPGTIARMKAGDRRFVVEQRTMIRNRAGARKSVAEVSELTESGKQNTTTVESSLYNTEVAIDDAIDAVVFLAQIDKDEIEVERV